MLGPLDLMLSFTAAASLGVLALRVVLAVNGMDSTIATLTHENVIYRTRAEASEDIIADREARIAIQENLLRLAGERLNSAIIEMNPAPMHESVAEQPAP